MPNFALLPFSSALEALRAANRWAGRTVYEWLFISADGKPVPSSAGIEVVPKHSIATADRLSDLIVVAGGSCENYSDRSVFAWLRRLDRHGCRLGALSLGTYVLARAGLLDGYRCTLHWENLSSFREEFPHIDATAEVFEVDRNRFTCSGGTAALDLMLSLIAEEHGRDLAVQVAEQFIHERIRDSHDQQRMALRMRLGLSHSKLLQAVAMMEQHQEDKLGRTGLARQLDLTPRQLERLFRRYLGCSPSQYYRSLRLQRARRLILQTSMPITEIAAACGFASASNFSKSYREYFGKVPSRERLPLATAIERRWAQVSEKSRPAGWAGRGARQTRVVRSPQRAG